MGGAEQGCRGPRFRGALGYQRWTNPAAVREQVIAEIGKTFPGAQVSVDSARLRILGGIQLNGLRLTRADDPEKAEFLHVPSAIFYHDKEKIVIRNYEGKIFEYPETGNESAEFARSQSQRDYHEEFLYS